jgi:hypothetical protein
MQLAEAIGCVIGILGRGEKTEADERRYRIELQALMDVYEGNPFDDQRWNITDAYVYREAWVRGQTQANLEGKGTITYEPRRDHAERT